MAGIDFVKTLDPALGIVREVAVVPPRFPSYPLWTVGADIGLSDLREDGTVFDMTWAGAAGVRRSHTLARAAGEAVERYALIPAVGLDKYVGNRVFPAGYSWDPKASSRGMYRASELVCGELVDDCGVPSEAVDYPVRLPSGLCDQGPSGAAAGDGYMSALRSACKELIERDACMRGWYCPSSNLVRLDLEKLGECGAEVLEAVRLAVGISPGAELHLCAVSGVSKCQVILAFLVDRSCGIVGAGLGLEARTEASIVRAIQESIQICCLLRDFRESDGHVDMPFLPIKREVDRARYWSGPDAVALFDRWLALLPPESVSIQRSIFDGWVAAVGRIAAVDLTPRLPVAVQGLGWGVVRVFSADLRPLRISDALPWSDAGRDHDIPHPFI